MLKLVPKYRYNSSLKKLFLSILLLLILTMSWLLSITHPFWEWVDLHFFKWANGFIATSTFWQNFWAIANHSLTDWFHDLVVFFFFAYYIAKPSDKSPLKKTSEIVVFAILITFSILMINRYLFIEILPVMRKSPSMICDFTVLLSEKVRWLKVKDRSVASFPGDHGTFAIMFVLIVYHLMGRRAALLAFIYGLYWLMPRLVTGAHWFTDLFIGSFVISAFMISLVIYTPLKELLSSFIYRFFILLKRNKPNLRLEKS